MHISSLLWPEDRIDHTARHGITPEEVEEVCFGRPLTLRAKSDGPHPLYYYMGQTHSGRYVFCVIIVFPDGNGYPVTARPMTMKKTRLPTTDSIEELARFWQEHDITDFEDELEEVPEPVLRRADETTIHIHLSKQEMGQLQEVAGQIGVDLKTLIHKWIHEKLQTA